MSRWEFMRQLEELLFDISPSEREEALQYYNDYFNDAGRENEQEVIMALGSPAQVAGIVRDGLSENVSSGEFTESGFKSAASSQQNPIMKREDSLNKKDIFTEQDEKTDENGRDNINSSKNYENTQKDSYREEGSTAFDDAQTGSGRKAETSGDGAYAKEMKNSSQEKKEGLPTWAIVLIIIGGILLAPAILGGIGGIIGSLFGIVAAIAALVLGIGLTSLILYIAAVLLIVAGVGCIFVAPVKGIGLLGGGFICGALGILCMLLTYFLIKKVIPGIFYGIVFVYYKIKDKIGGWKG
ncbi:HAAS signaling domain-containing protein [Parablautia muri]|uniref:DUF1700 domain-containing protein n=1 Tax=Parablautia muri TaxID=2320879 RepID=A0A9X5BFU1_9FIRM|nr:MMPL family transporter [Parablautia muri]NBJ93165.1 hypothetical protein [Parablautia muri]